jgi:hypothetical protein
VRLLFGPDIGASSRKAVLLRPDGTVTAAVDQLPTASWRWPVAKERGGHLHDGVTAACLCALSRPSASLLRTLAPPRRCTEGHTCNSRRRNVADFQSTANSANVNASRRPNN